MIHLLTYQGDGVPPGLNNAYFTNAHGGRTMTSEIKRWKAETIGNVKSQINEASADYREHAKKPLAIQIKLWLPKLYVSDWDGHVKVLQDAIMKAMGLDDAYIVQANVSKRHDKHNPRFQVTVWRI